jgi:hypothetical protein
MAKDSKNKDDVKNWKERFNSTAGMWIAIFTLIGLGFGAGQVVADIFHKIEMNELNQKYNSDLYEKVKEFDALILELKNENQLLKVENERLKK